MARKGALKVFRTPIGFHDAYVAATSRKAALEAWGAEKDLFASGSAELVTDPKLTAAPLGAPGTVIKLARGTLSEHLRAAGRAAAKPAKRKPEGTATTPAERQPKRPAKPKPRPSRAALDRAEAGIAAFEEKAARERAELDKAEAELLKRRKALNARHRREGERLDARRELAHDRYEAAMERWRAE